ncbi:MAG: metallophosphoesterase [Clostridia bacterium]|nr:metallophosphoesterase [Clostridia bacterium]
MLKLKQKPILITLSILLLLFCIVFCCVHFLFFHHYIGSKNTEVWQSDVPFQIESIATIQKEKNKDFVILNLADVQMCDLENTFNKSEIRNEIAYLIRKTKPNLITLTGDQTWSNENLISLTSLISWLDSFKIPYAPVFGNHDYGNEKNSAVASENFCCDLYSQGKYSMFKRGPSNIGSLGNYVINIIEDGKIYKTLYMLNSGYDEKISDSQIQWFKWNAEGIKNFNNGEYSSGMCFLHKPLPEYATAYRKYLNGESDVQVIGDVYVNDSLFGSLQNGFFQTTKTCSVKDIICGHQHGNNFTLAYQGVRLTFALKTGKLGGFYQDETICLNGATVLKLNETTLIENCFFN